MKFQDASATLKFGIFLALIAVVFLGGCFEDPEDCTPADTLTCSRSKPMGARMKITVSYDPLPTVVNIYEGPYYETGRLVWSGSPEGFSWSVDLPFGEYSATATYKVGSKTIIAVDADDLDYSSVKTCEGGCYDAENGEVNLELED